MKEKINKICLTASMVTGLICFTGCSDDFLKDKKVYGSYDASVVYENYETAKSRVDFLYQSLLPSSTGGSNALTDITKAKRAAVKEALKSLPKVVVVGTSFVGKGAMNIILNIIGGKKVKEADETKGKHA